MDWSEAAIIMFSCVTANHLGLVAAVERVVNHRLPIVGCPKCFTFWSVLAYGLILGSDPVEAVAASFFYAYLASWLLLFFGLVDTLYNNVYDKIYSATDTTADGAEHTERAVSDVSGESEREERSENSKKE